MTELEMDALVARLVPEFESSKLRAIIARQEFEAVSGCAEVDRHVVTDARERWLELEDRCGAILRRIDALAESSTS